MLKGEEKVLFGFVFLVVFLYSWIKGILLRFWVFNCFCKLIKLVNLNDWMKIWFGLVKFVFCRVWIRGFFKDKFCWLKNVGCLVFG